MAIYMDFSLVNMIVLTMIIVNYLILLPLYCWCAYILYQYKRIQIFRSRRVMPLQWVYGLTFIVFAISQPFRIFDGSIPDMPYTIPHILPLWMSSSIEYSITLLLLLIYSWRTYLIHYDFNYHKAVLSNEWKEFSPKHQRQSQWYLTNKNRLGNQIYTLCLTFIVWILLSTILTVLTYYTGIESNWIILQLIFFVTAEIFILKFILKMPGLDIFRIRDEYTWLLTMGLTLIIIVIVLLIFYDNSNQKQILLSRLMYHGSMMIGSVLISSTSVLYPLHVYRSINADLKNKNTKNETKNRRKYSISTNTNTNTKPKKASTPVPTSSGTHFKFNNASKYSPQLTPGTPHIDLPRAVSSPTGITLDELLSSPSNRDRDIHLDVIEMGKLSPLSSTVTKHGNNIQPPIVRSKSHSLLRSHSISTQSSYKVNLEDIMKSLVGIEAFLKHLVQEISTENLFFLSDIVQYKNAFITEGYLKQIPGWIMELPANIPISLILLNNNDPYIRSQKINDLYIRFNSEREINISYSTRNRIIKQFDEADVLLKPDVYGYCTRFDIAAAEIKRLLMDSFRRFTLTPQYHKFGRDYYSGVRKLQRKLSRSVRTITRELSRDRSMSKDNSMGVHVPQFIRQTSPRRLSNITNINKKNHSRNALTPYQSPPMTIHEIDEKMHPSPPQLSISNNNSNHSNNHPLPPMYPQSSVPSVASNTMTNTNTILLKLPYTHTSNHSAPYHASVKSNTDDIDIDHDDTDSIKHVQQNSIRSTTISKRNMDDNNLTIHVSYPSGTGTGTGSEERSELQLDHKNDDNGNDVLSILTPINIQPSITPPPPITPFPHDHAHTTTASLQLKLTQNIDNDDNTDNINKATNKNTKESDSDNDSAESTAM